MGMPLYDLEFKWRIVLIILIWGITQVGSARLVQLLPDGGAMFRGGYSSSINATMSVMNQSENHRHRKVSI